MVSPLTFLPATPGLLISMAIRYDHSFGIWMGQFERAATLEDKQIKILGEAVDYLRRRHELSNSATGTTAQLLEEMTGVGFYRPEREEQYQASATPRGLGEAERLLRELNDE